MNAINEAGHDNTHTGFYMSSLGLLSNCVVTREAMVRVILIKAYSVYGLALTVQDEASCEPWSF